MTQTFVPRAALALVASFLFAAPANALDLQFDLASPFGLGQAAEPAPAAEPGATRLAQAGGDPFVRIDQLQEEVRALNGRVEDLSFQLLQVQDQMRKVQDDNEFRFQELEGASATPAGERTDAAPAPAADGSGDAEFAQAPSAASADPAAAAPTGDPVADILQSGLDLDAVASTGGEGAPAPGEAPAAPPAPSQTVAAITPGSPAEMYDLAYNYLLAGDYQLAEDAFRQYAQTYPTASDAPDAQYWLGESQFAQGEFADAAETFLSAQKSHPDSAKAPEMMLKLGMALAALDNRETACVTFAEVSRRYPGMSASVQRKLEAEQAASSCG